MTSHPLSFDIRGRFYGLPNRIAEVTSKQRWPRVTVLCHQDGPSIPCWPSQRQPCAFQCRFHGLESLLLSRRKHGPLNTIDPLSNRTTPPPGRPTLPTLPSSNPAAPAFPKD